MATDPDAWAGDRVDRWLRQVDNLEIQLAPAADLLFAAAALTPGEAVVDIGCGTGPTTLRAAQLVGPTGRVTGLDVSAEMLVAARERTSAADPATDIEWQVADLVAWAPSGPSYDVAISRFGVMFFSDPARALTNLAHGVRPGGRLAFAVWGPRAESRLFEVPFRAAVAAVPDREPPPADEGPFSWHDDDYVLDLLTTSGWTDIASETTVVGMQFGGGLDPVTAAETALDFGPTRLLLADASIEERATARNAIAAALADHLDDAGHVLLDGSVRVITARNGSAGG